LQDCLVSLILQAAILQRVSCKILLESRLSYRLFSPNMKCSAKSNKFQVILLSTLYLIISVYGDITNLFDDLYTQQNY
jgi:hypothetical protein